MVNAKGDSFLQAADTTCSAVYDWLAGKEVDSDMKALFDKTEVGLKVVCLKPLDPFGTEKNKKQKKFTDFQINYRVYRR